MSSSPNLNHRVTFPASLVDRVQTSELTLYQSDAPSEDFDLNVRKQGPLRIHDKGDGRVTQVQGEKCWGFRCPGVARQTTGQLPAAVLGMW